MTDFFLIAKKQSARLRAWAGHGVPVDGHWSFDAHRGSRGIFEVTVRCTRCDLGGSSWVALGFRWSLRHDLESALRRSIRCNHLLPLLGSDPPEVSATAELELLAGD